MKQYLSLKASAGSGKTFALTVRYISLLLNGAHPTQILTLTFTNKAASEMSQRIFKTLQTLGNDEAYLNAIMQQIGLSKEEILQKKQQLLDSYINAELSIYTIDKFINKILREFSGYIDISDDFSIENSDEDLLIYKYLQSLEYDEFSRLIDFAYIQDKKLNSILDVFKKLQEKNETYFVNSAIEYKQLAWIKQEILQNAFKIKEYIENFDGMSSRGINAVDFNSVEELISKGSTWLDKDELEQYTYFKKAKPVHLQNEFEQIKIDLVKYYKITEQLILNSLYAMYNGYEKFILEYNKQKNILTFNEITNLVYRLFQDTLNDNNDFLYFRLDAKYNHLLIDEFQDTSILQYKILEPIIEEIVSGFSQTFKSFFYVGDTKQSIYRFRGGNAQLFDYVREKYPQIELEELETNYRSSQQVVGFVNKVFETLPNYEYSNQKIHSSVDGYVAIEAFEHEESVALQMIAKQVEQLLQNGMDANDICILTFTNEDVLNIYNYLKSAFPQLKINTEMTSKLIYQKNVSALINAIKYCYFQESIYQENFNALLGKPLKEPMVKINEITKKPLVQIVYYLANFYKLLDENVLKFIEIVQGYESIIDFVYKIDINDTTMVNKEKSGLQIMTIFKSKGLEFETVILLDKLNKQMQNRDSLVFEYDQIELQHIYYKQKSRDNFDVDFANALQKEQKLNTLDQLNVLYVALTRAKNNMIILKKKEKSIFDMLDSSFEKCNFGKLHIEQKYQIAVPEKNIIQYNPMDLGFQEKNTISQEEDSSNLYAQYFGIATHYCLEMMKDFDIESLKKTIPLIKSKFEYILDEESFKDIEKRIFLLINNNEFINLIDGAEVYKEQPIIFNGELKIIDLIVVRKNEIIIIDYKTTQQEQETHINQIKNYEKAIKSLYHDKMVNSSIIYFKQDYVNIKRL